MRISLNIIIDIISGYRFNSHVKDDNNTFFTTCLLLPDKFAKINNSCLYVGKLSAALELKNHHDFFCLCLRDRVTDDLETDHHLSNFIIINENVSLSTLLTQIQTRFFDVSDWINQMNDVLVRNGTLQDLVDAGASLPDNYINITDASFMLMACSKNIPCDDPISISLAEHGYHPEESIQKFRKNDLFSKWQKEDAIYIDASFITVKYPALNKIFKFRGTYFSHIVMVCNRHPPTPGMIDLFQIFIDVLTIYMERVWESMSTENHIYDSLLTDLVEGNITSKNIIEERAKNLELPVTGIFCLFQIISKDQTNVSVGKMLLELSELFPKIRFIRYQQKIVVINQFYDRDDINDQLKIITVTLENFLEKYDAICGVSLFFANIFEVSYAYTQSSLALSYLKTLDESDTYQKLKLSASTDSRVHHFGQFYVFSLLGDKKDNAEIWYHSEFYHMIKKLYDYDMKHQSNTIQLLHLYLNNERSATKTAAYLKMHRNNVIYHISRIEQMLHVDFHDPATRFTMQLSFFLLALYGIERD